MITNLSSTLHALSGTSAADVWAVGDGGTVLREDGSGWRPLRTSIPSDLRGVAVTATVVNFAGDQLYGIFRASPMLP